jgi:hypothetical protein
MRRTRLVRTVTRLARTLGRFDRVGVVSFIGCALCFGLLLLLDHGRDSNALLLGNDPTGNRQG